jgi:hypothetical protein
MTYVPVTQYQRFVNGLVTNTWTSLDNGADYTEPGWGDPSTYQIVATVLGQDVDPNWVALRAARDNLLSACDWTQLPDSPLATLDKNACVTYRAALRNLPDVTTDPTNITWPAVPAVLQ